MAKVPSGTVTFLFSDIEGSTARWEQQPETMRIALARHDALIRAASCQHGGNVVNAVAGALSPFGIDDLHAPLDELIWQTIQGARHAG